MNRLGRSETAEVLLQYEGDVNLKAHQNLTPLHVAAWHGHSETVELLIRKGDYGNAVLQPIH